MEKSPSGGLSNESPSDSRKHHTEILSAQPRLGGAKKDNVYSDYIDTKENDGLMRIKTIRCGIVKCYLVAGESGRVLIDTGMKGYKKRVLKTIRREGVKDGIPLKSIILTHAHNDHSDNAAFLSRETGAPVLISRNDYDIINTDMVARIRTHDILGHIVLICTHIIFGGKKVEEFTPSVLLEGGEKLTAAEYGLDMEIVTFPGHSAGSIGIVIGDILFAGDTFPKVRRFFSHAIYENLDDLTSSGEKMRALPIKKIYFGHGRPRKMRR